MAVVHEGLKYLQSIVVSNSYDVICYVMSFTSTVTLIYALMASLKIHALSFDQLLSCCI